MFKFIITPFILAIFSLQNAAIASSDAPDAQQIIQMIKKADNYRLDHQSAKVVSKVTLYKKGVVDKIRQYTVYLRDNRDSLVIFNSHVEAGQKMLMVGDNYWLLMPKSRRPIRITPMQKLLGEASIGDISTLTWSEDYQGKWVKQESLSFEDGEGKAQVAETNLLRLHAKTKGASYFDIDLWLDKETGFPIKADLYLQSGKLAKQAWFIKGIKAGSARVISMKLEDKIQRNQQTIIEYQSITAVTIDEKFYNPAYLARTKSLSL